MSPRDSSSHNDSRANRLPYHPEPRQGRFGRVENWREAEEKKAEQIRRQRQAHSRRAMQSQSAAQAATQTRSAAGGAHAQGQHSVTSAKRASGQTQGPAQAQANVRQASSQSHNATRQQAKQAPAKTSAPAKAAQPQHARKRAIEPNPWQQGRFGRVENWREEEARRARRQEAIEAAQAQAARDAEQAQRAVQSQGEAKTRKAVQGQAHASNHTRNNVQAQKQETARARRQAAQMPASAKPSAHQQATTQAQAKAKQGAHAQQQGLHSRPRQQGAHSKPAASTVAATAGAQQHARESYASSLQDSDVAFYAAHEGVQGKFDRRPAVDYPADRRKSLTGKLPRIPMKLVGAIAAVLVIAVVIGFFAFGGDDEAVVPAAETNATAVATKTPSLPTPIMSESSGITMHSAVAMEDLTEVLIHNASYAYANEITTQLTEATNVDVIDAHGTGRDATAQPTGDSWMTGEFIRCFRSGNAGPVMSAIDCGGPVGATVYAPVTGEVVMVKEYLLYDQIDDFRVHIQPTGRPDLDVVLIHLTDVTVKPGDKVTAGVTPIAKIRDIYQYLDESLQLRQYTAESDNGNHTHIQVNNANHPEYTALDELKQQGAEAAAGNVSTQ